MLNTSSATNSLITALINNGATNSPNTVPSTPLKFLVGGAMALPGGGGGVPNGMGSNVPGKRNTAWLQLDVCREFVRSKCSRSADDCKFAHPPQHVEVNDGKVICCYDFIKNKCNRVEPPCKYLHPPEHLQKQLIEKGRQNLIIKNVADQNLQALQCLQSLQAQALQQQQPPMIPQQQGFMPQNFNFLLNQLQQQQQVQQMSVAPSTCQFLQHNVTTLTNAGGNFSNVPSPMILQQAAYPFIPIQFSNDLSNAMMVNSANMSAATMAHKAAVSKNKDESVNSGSNISASQVSVESFPEFPPAAITAANANAINLNNTNLQFGGYLPNEGHPMVPGSLNDQSSNLANRKRPYYHETAFGQIPLSSAAASLREWSLNPSPSVNYPMPMDGTISTLLNFVPDTATNMNEVLQQQQQAFFAQQLLNYNLSQQQFAKKPLLVNQSGGGPEPANHMPNPVYNAIGRNHLVNLGTDNNNSQT